MFLETQEAVKTDQITRFCMMVRKRKEIGGEVQFPREVRGMFSFMRIFLRAFRAPHHIAASKHWSTTKVGEAPGNRACSLHTLLLCRDFCRLRRSYWKAIWSNVEAGKFVICVKGTVLNVCFSPKRQHPLVSWFIMEFISKYDDTLILHAVQ